MINRNSQIPKEDLDYISNILMQRKKQNENTNITKNYLKVVVKDKNGKIVDDRIEKMHSLTNNFLALIFILTAGTTQYGASNWEAWDFIVNYLGLPKKLNLPLYDLLDEYYGTPQKNANASIIQWYYTIALGTGQQAFSLNLNSLANQISDCDTNPGVLSCNNATLTINESSSMIINQTANNTSNNQITITEYGLMGKILLTYFYINKYGYVEYKSDIYPRLFSYDVLKTPITIPPLGSANLQINVAFA